MTDPIEDLLERAERDTRLAWASLLDAERVRRGWSLEHLAVRAELGENTVKRTLRGHHDARLSTFVRLSVVLRVMLKPTSRAA